MYLHAQNAYILLYKSTLKYISINIWWHKVCFSTKCPCKIGCGRLLWGCILCEGKYSTFNLSRMKEYKICYQNHGIKTDLREWRHGILQMRRLLRVSRKHTLGSAIQLSTNWLANVTLILVHFSRLLKQRLLQVHKETEEENKCHYKKWGFKPGFRYI